MKLALHTFLLSPKDIVQRRRGELSGDVEVHAFSNQVGRLVASACDDFHATVSSEGLVGDADICIYEGTGVGAKKNAAIVGEARTFWDLNVKEHMNLVDLFRACAVLEEEDESLERKVFDAVSQLSRYVRSNHLRYGFLSTWEQWWFMRHDPDMRLGISRPFKYDAENPTVCQVLGRMLLKSRNQTKEAAQDDRKIK